MRNFFATSLSVYGEDLSESRPTLNLEDHPLSAVRDCLSYIFAATLCNWRSFLSRQLEDAPCYGDRNPLIRGHCFLVNRMFKYPEIFGKLQQQDGSLIFHNVDVMWIFFAIFIWEKKCSSMKVRPKTLIICRAWLVRSRKFRSGVPRNYFLGFHRSVSL